MGPQGGTWQWCGAEGGFPLEIRNQVRSFICKAGQHLGCQPIAQDKNEAQVLREA